MYYYFCNSYFLEVTASNLHGVGTGAGSTSGIGMRGGVRDASATGIETAIAQGEGFDGHGMGGYSGESNIANSYLGTMPPPYEKSGTLNMAYVENYFAEVRCIIILRMYVFAKE